MKWIVWIVVLALIIWAGFAIFGGNETANAEPIKIGAIISLTGDAAAYGEPGRNIYALAVEEINNAGGIDGRMIEMIYEDGQCDGTTAANAAQKLVNVDKVEAIIGGFCSSESLAAVPIAATGKVLLFSPGSSSPDLTGINQFFARNYPSDASQGKVLADLVYARGMRKVAFIQETKDYPLGIFKAFDARFKELGGTTVKEEFASEATDFRTSLTKLKGMNPDALFVDTQTPASGERVLKQVQELKWKTQIIISDAISGDPKTVSDNSSVLEGALAAEFGTNPENAKFQSLIANYKTKYGSDMPFQSYGQTEYDSIYILVDGIKVVGYDGEKLATWIRTVSNWQGASGSVTIGADGDLVGGHVAKVIKNGKVELLQ